MRFILLPVLFLVLIGGCVHTKEATYLQEYTESLYSGDYVPPEDYLVQTNDNLHIRISTPDPQWSTIFNAGGEGNTNGVTEASLYLYSYPVQPDGTVELPYIGFVDVAGKTLHEVKSDIETVLKDYIRDADISVRLVNNNVAILGEVMSPGLYPIYKDRLNVFQALALAGDVADFGDRYNIRIIRQGMSGSEVVEFDLTDRKIIDSEYYYVLPNDVLYVKPKKGRYFSVNQAPYTFALTTITATLSIWILIQNMIIIRDQ